MVQLTEAHTHSSNLQGSSLKAGPGRQLAATPHGTLSSASWLAVQPVPCCRPLLVQSLV